jgi:hypothetical protein
MLTLVLALCSTAVPEHLAINRFEAAGVEPERATRFGAQLGEKLRTLGFEVSIEEDTPGADAVVTGTLAKLDDAYEATVTITDARTARVLATRRVKGKTEQAMLAGLSYAAEQLAAEVRGERGPLPRSRPQCWGPLFGGAAVLGVVSGLFFGLAGSQAGGWVSAGVGGVLAVLGFVALLYPMPYQVQVALWASPQGSALALGGAW